MKMWEAVLIFGLRGILAPDLMSYHRIGILISVQNLVIRSLQMPISVTTRDRRQRTLYFISIFSRPGKASTS